MRGIIWEDVRRVRLVTAKHPEVRAHVQRMAYHTTVRLETKFHERAQERARLAALLGEPMEHLLTQDAMLDAYIAHVYQATSPPPLSPPTCRDCRHCAADRFHPGGFVCWQGWTSGPPKRLTTLTVCDALADKRLHATSPSRWQIGQEMQAMLAAHGISYNGARWKAHRHDLAREAGDWGFDVGKQWEAAVRTWLGEDFFMPHRWLIIDTRTGAQQFREVDGIERVDALHAFVYEIKHNVSAYRQLAQEYIPLLQRAYPDRVFTPIEINVADPYEYYPPVGALPLRRLDSLAERSMDGQYQLLILPEIPKDDEAVHQGAYEGASRV